MARLTGLPPLAWSLAWSAQLRALIQPSADLLAVDEQMGAHSVCPPTSQPLTSILITQEINGKGIATLKCTRAAV